VRPWRSTWVAANRLSKPLLKRQQEGKGKAVSDGQTCAFAGKVGVGLKTAITVQRRRMKKQQRQRSKAGQQFDPT